MLPFKRRICAQGQWYSLKNHEAPRAQIVNLRPFNFKKRSNHLSIKEQKILYKGSSLEYYVALENSQEMRIQVKTKSISQDKVTGDRITIGWNESDAVVLRWESK